MSEHAPGGPKEPYYPATANLSANATFIHRSTEDDRTPDVHTHDTGAQEEHLKTSAEPHDTPEQTPALNTEASKGQSHQNRPTHRSGGTSSQRQRKQGVGSAQEKGGEARKPRQVTMLEFGGGKGKETKTVAYFNREGDVIPFADIADKPFYFTTKGNVIYYAPSGANGEVLKVRVKGKSITGFDQVRDDSGDHPRRGIRIGSRFNLKDRDTTGTVQAVVVGDYHPIEATGLAEKRTQESPLDIYGRTYAQWKNKTEGNREATAETSAETVTRTKDSDVDTGKDNQLPKRRSDVEGKNLRVAPDHGLSSITEKMKRNLEGESAASHPSQTPEQAKTPEALWTNEANHTKILYPEIGGNLEEYAAIVKSGVEIPLGSIPDEAVIFCEGGECVYLEGAYLDAYDLNRHIRHDLNPDNWNEHTTLTIGKEFSIGKTAYSKIIEVQIDAKKTHNADSEAAKSMMHGTENPIDLAANIADDIDAEQPFGDTLLAAPETPTQIRRPEADTDTSNEYRFSVNLKGNHQKDLKAFLQSVGITPSRRNAHLLEEVLIEGDQTSLHDHYVEAVENQDDTFEREYVLTEDELEELKQRMQQTGKLRRAFNRNTPKVIEPTLRAGKEMLSDVREQVQSLRIRERAKELGGWIKVSLDQKLGVLASANLVQRGEQEELPESKVISVKKGHDYQSVVDFLNSIDYPASDANIGLVLGALNTDENKKALRGADQESVELEISGKVIKQLKQF